MIAGERAIRDAYRDDRVASDYVRNRFVEPLGALLHRRQTEVLRALIARARPSRVLEIAPGPARLTAAVAPAFDRPPVLVDASAQMLAEARRRLADADRSASLVEGDAFRLPFGAVFDLVYTFRLIRHFGDEDRARLYRQIAAVLKPGGLLAFDAVNAEVAAPLREAARPGEYAHYDALVDEATLGRELGDAGFTDVTLYGVQHRYRALQAVQNLVAPRSRAAARAAMAVLDRSGGPPLEWVVTCRRG